VFTQCAQCGLEGTHNWVSVVLGGVLCDECAPPQTPYVTDDDVALLVALLEGDWPAVNQAQPAQMRQATGFIAEYLQYHLEHHLQSLPVMDHGQLPHQPNMPYEEPPPHPDCVVMPTINSQFIPQHVPIVMDGNGRWAIQRGLPRTEGQRAGEQALLYVMAG